MTTTYITYERDQQRIVDQDGLLRVPNFSPNEYPTLFRAASPPLLEDIYDSQKPSGFKPTWLVRTSDMQLVRGSEVGGKYYALSYSWSQSGDCSKDDTSNKQLRQKLVLYRKMKKRIHPRGRTKTRVAVKPRFITFEDLIYQISKDFGIRYVWWDQWCINQASKEEKQHEIKQMHEIYKNAYCTVVLVPELEFNGMQAHLPGYYAADIDIISETEWIKRAWTLEEAFMSKRLLFLGRNVHMWSHTSDDILLSESNTAMFLRAVCTRGMNWNACIALQYARKRTSTKDHDRYFALANMFPEKMDDLNPSYKQPLNDLALWFYERLASDDVSILYFGKPESSYSDNTVELLIPEPEDTFLPSWSGVSGLHVRRLFHTSKHDGLECFGLSPDNYTVSGNCMTLTCTSISVSIQKENEYDQNPERWTRIMDGEVVHDLKISSSSYNNLTFVATTGYNMYDGFRLRDSYGLQGTHFLPFIEESGTLFNSLSSPNIYGGLMSLTEDCDECVILFGVSFEDHHLRNCYVYPVITKHANHYKAVGICLLFQAPNLCTEIVTKEKQKFVIK